MTESGNENRVQVEIDEDLWNKCYTVNSLVIIGSKEKDGSYNLAPKHMAMPLGFSQYFGFMGTPRKTTYQNVKREGTFTVSFPNPDQIVLSSLAATRREDDQSKVVIDKIPTIAAKSIEGILLEGAYFQLECKLSDILGKFGEWELIVGEVLAAYIDPKSIRKSTEDSGSGQLINNSPLLAYLHPDRFSTIKESNHFPLPKNFNR